MNSTIRSRAVRGAVALLTGAALLGGIAAPASAAPVSLPDGTANAKLTLHKHESPSTATKNDGLTKTVTAAAVKDVVFKVERITAIGGTNIDLTTRAGWEAAAAATPATAAAGTKAAAVYNKTGDDKGSVSTAPDANGVLTGGTAVTENDDEAIFDALPIGLYLVTEQWAPAGVIKSAPFLVTLPLTHPTALNSWLFDVNIYPKNDVINVTKAVDESAYTKIGDAIKWPITAEIPIDENITSFTVTDDLDSRLDFVSVTNVKIGATTLAAGEYTVNPASATTGGPIVTVTLTASGLTRANNVNVANTNLTFDLNTTVNNTLTDTNTIPNTVALKVNSLPDLTATATAQLGGLYIKKVKAEDDTDLAGAEFSLFKGVCNDATLATAALDVNGSAAGGTTLTSNASGDIKVNGLQAGTYCLLETKAPSGRELLADPIQVVVTDGNTPSTATVTVKNVLHNAGFELPLVGGSGTFLLVAGGVGIVALALGLVRRRPQE